MGSGFPYCGYLEPEDFFGTDFTDYADFLRAVFGTDFADYAVWGQGG